MNGLEYQSLAMRTNDGKGTDRIMSEISVSSSKRDVGGLLNGVLGLTGEAGEVSDLVKKGIFHEKGIDDEHLKKELGDVCWYLAMICESCNYSLDDIMQINVDKLKKRYPDGFDVVKANNRAKGDI